MSNNDGMIDKIEREFNLMTKLMFEILDELLNAKTDEERVAILRKNDSYALRGVLRAAFHPRIYFNVTKWPDGYVPSEVPAGYGSAKIGLELNRIYMFELGNPRTPLGLTEKRKNEILLQILEALEHREAEVFMNMMLKDLKVPGLTKELVEEAFPDILN
jgi:hypothetical protein